MFMTIENEDDRDFIEGLYRKYYKLCYKKAYDLVQNHAVAEDMIGEAFLKLINKTQLLEDMEHFKVCAYIVITVENTCKTFLTSSNKQVKHITYFSDDIISHMPSNFSTEKAVYDKLDREAAARAMMTLNSNEQDLLVKTYYEKMSDKQIAAETGMPYRNIRTYRSRLIKKIERLCRTESEEKSS